MRLSNVVIASIAGVCALSAGVAWIGNSSLFFPQGSKKLKQEAVFANDSLAQRFVQQMAGSGGDEWSRWQGAVVERPAPVPSQGLARSLIYPVKSQGQSSGYVAVGRAPDKPVIQAFTPHSSRDMTPYLSTFIPSTRATEPAALKAIPNFPLLESAQGDNALIGGLVVFWSGRVPALNQAVRAQEQMSIPSGSRIEAAQWAMNQLKQVAALGQRNLQTNRLSQDQATAPLFNDYRIEIDQGRPVLVILFPTKEASQSPSTPCLAVGTGYLINEEGRFLALQVWDEGAQSSGHVYVRWESVQPNIDLIRVKPTE